LVSEKYCEGDSLDFKAIVKFDDPEGTGIRDFLKDIVSFANHRGGYIIIGIGELKEKKDQAGDVVAVTDCEKLARRCRDLCNEHIEPRLWGLEIQSIPFEGADGAVVIKVPRSFHAPHMITFNNLNQFWIRGGRENRLMSVEEIKYACRITQNIFQDLNEFLEDRRRAFQAELPQYPVIRTTATPLLVEEDVVDIQNEAIRLALTNPPSYDEKNWCIKCENVVPSLYGLDGFNSYHKSFGKCALFRNGHFEWVRRAESLLDPTFTKKIGLMPIALTGFIVNFHRIAWHLYNLISLSVPIVVAVEFYGLGSTLLAGHLIRFEPYDDWRELRNDKDKQRLIIGPRQVYLTQSPGIVSKDLCNILWNAYSFEKAIHFTDTGEWPA